MKDELKYKIEVEPMLFTIFNKIAGDVGMFGVSEDEFTRAMWSWADSKINDYEAPPVWLWMELDRKRQQADSLNTVDGEVGT